MELSKRLLATLPGLKTPIQLFGLLFIIAGGISLRTVAVDTPLIALPIFSIGVCFLFFGQVFYYASTLPPEHGGPIITRSFFAFLLFIMGCLIILALFLKKPPAPRCDTFTGEWVRDFDNLSFQLTQDGNKIYGYTSRSGVSHELEGTISQTRAYVAVTRQNPQCKTVMNMTLDLEPNNCSIHQHVIKTDGKCDLNENYTENFMWSKRYTQ